MNYANSKETEGSPPLPPEDLSIRREEKPSVSGWAKPILVRFAPLTHPGHWPILNGIRINKEFWSSALRAQDPALIVQVLGLAAPWVVFLGSLVVYVLTAAPTVFGWDSAEYATVAYKLGVPHATGYPLYVLIGKLATYLPFGDVGYRLNLMSAFFAAGTVTVVYLLAFFITHRRILSVAVAGFLAFSYYFWSSAVVTEVYSLHALLNASTIYLLLRWNREGNDRLLYGGIFIWGLSFGNHMTTVLLGPAIAFLIGMGLWDRRVKRQHLLPLAACFVIPLAVYVYLPLRYLADAVPYVMSYYTAEGDLVRVNTTTIEGMWSVLTARQFEYLFRAYQGPGYLEQLKQLMFLTVYANFLGVGLVLGMLGLLRNYIADKQRLIFLGLIFSANLLFFADYGALDKQFMAVTSLVVWAVWIADGAYYILNTIENLSPDQWLGRFRSIAGQRVQQIRWEMFAVLLPLAALWVNFSYADLSSFTHVRDTYPRIMESFGPNALVFAWWADLAPMQYYQQVENLRPDVQLIDRFLISPEAEIRLIDESLPHRPVYVFEGFERGVPHPKFEVPALWGSFETGYKVIPPD